MSRRDLYNQAIAQRLKEWYGQDYVDAFMTVLDFGYEPAWMSDYFDTWHELNDEFRGAGISNDEFYQEAYDAAHDVAIGIKDGLDEEMAMGI